MVAEYHQEPYSLTSIIGFVLSLSLFCSILAYNMLTPRKKKNVISEQQEIIYQV